ncbi:MAG: carbamate kinase [Bacteroidales bacterium]
MGKIAVVAFGGNALLRGDQKGTIDEQRANAKETCEKLLLLIKSGYDIVLTHGNGPQVGNIILSNSAGNKVYGLPDMPMDVCGAYSQGFIGYVLEQQLRNTLVENNIDKNVVTIVTQVVVDKDDEAFKNPTKPVGPFYDEQSYQKMLEEQGGTYAKDPRGRGWRKVVASPKPLRIVNQEIIKQLALEGNIVIASGGGGIPVVSENGLLRGVEAVIDKDLASAVLAKNINADQFCILTDVPKVCLHFNTPEQITLSNLTTQEAKQYLNEGHFAEGSMAPKVRSAIIFAENTGNEAIITSPETIGLENSGTIISNSK